MKARFLVACFLLLSLTAGLAPAAGAGQSPAATPQPPESPHILQHQAAAAENDRGVGPLDLTELPSDPASPPREVRRTPLAGQAQVTAPEATGGPDDFGYTWDDAQGYSWVSATIDTGLYHDCEDLAAVPIGFNFKYYENTYATAYVSYNGWLTFQAGSGCYTPYEIPQPGYPDNVIAPYSQSFDSVGSVLYKQGGTAPNRYLVIEWRAMSDWCGPNTFTFETVLFENGDFDFRYQTMDYSDNCWYCADTGIEDSVGWDGLLYQECDQLPGLSAVRFFRPAPSARVKIWPPYQGHFAQPGADLHFDVPVRNTGELGTDTYDLGVSSAWTVSLFAADGVTPLVDTDFDGVVDTGPVAQGDTFSVVAALAVPGGAAVGDCDAVGLIATSSLNPAKSQVATLQAAVPAPFAQVYNDQADGAMSLELVQPVRDVVRKAAPDWTGGYNPAVAETPGGFAYVWSDYTWNGNVGYHELWYALYDRYGHALRAAAKLTDHSGATLSTYDLYPAVAATPDGQIAVLWYNYQYDNGLYNYNIYFAILDASGKLFYGPLNVTNNSAWGGYYDYNVPRFYNPALAATSDNRFVLAWNKQYYAPPGGGCSSDCIVRDIYYAVRSSGGTAVKPITQFTFDTPGWGEYYYYPNLAALSGARALLSWYRSSDDDIYYAVLDSAGNVVKDQTNLVDDGWRGYDYQPDAVQLSGGRTLVAWYTSGLDNPGEQGWTGTYYNNETLTPPEALQRSDDSIDFDWDYGSPDPLVNPDYFSVRWDGTIDVGAGTYTFEMGSDDGSVLRIDGSIVMDHWYECCTYWYADVVLSAGTHQVQMDMHEHGGAAWAHLYWWPQSQVAVIRYALLDDGYNRVAGPLALDAPSALTGSYNVSVAADAADHAVLTWSDNNRYNLLYALVDSSGEVASPAMLFHASIPNYIYTSYNGFGNTSWSWLAPAEVDGYAAFGATPGGPPGGAAMLEVQYGNHGATAAQNIELTATLDPALTYLWDTSGVAPVIIGNEVAWSLPAQGYLEEGAFLLYVGIPAGAGIGTYYTVQLDYVSDGPEANPEDNTAYGQVMAARQLFLPLMLRVK